MSFEDLFKPYSPKIKGDLETYLREHDGTIADNLFRGPQYFFIIKEKGLITPLLTCIRVNQSPIPDVCYFVNADYLLESAGPGEYNMSARGAKKGVYDPNEVLKDRGWSISNLNLQ
jgi:hypothetical protein